MARSIANRAVVAVAVGVLGDLNTVAGSSHSTIDSVLAWHDRNPVQFREPSGLELNNLHASRRAQ